MWRAFSPPPSSSACFFPKATEIFFPYSLQEQFVPIILNTVITMQNYPRIRALREDADLSQRALGEAINVSQRSYAYYESGQRMIPPSVLCALADFYGVSVDYLLGRTKRRETLR